MANNEAIKEEIKNIDEKISNRRDEILYLEKEAKEDRQNENPGIFNEETFVIESDRENANVDDFEKELYETNRKIEELQGQVEELEEERGKYESLLENGDEE